MRTIVKKSNIHGKGLFATRSFRKGDPIIPYKGEKISKRMFYQRYYPHLFGEYVVEVKTPITYYFIDAIDPKKSNDARYANDGTNTKKGCNAVFVTKGNTSWIFATKPILKNEEILVWYGNQYWG